MGYPTSDVTIKTHQEEELSEPVSTALAADQANGGLTIFFPGHRSLHQQRQCGLTVVSTAFAISRASRARRCFVPNDRSICFQFPSSFPRGFTKTPPAESHILEDKKKHGRPKK